MLNSSPTNTNIPERAINEISGSNSEFHSCHSHVNSSSTSTTADQNLSNLTSPEISPALQPLRISACSSNSSLHSSQSTVIDIPDEVSEVNQGLEKQSSVDSQNENNLGNRDQEEEEEEEEEFQDNDEQVLLPWMLESSCYI